MADVSDREWLNLSEAARILGVHPSTVRAWANRGELASLRTRGGHRRFRRADVEDWATSRQEGPPPGAALLVQSALGRARQEMGDGQLARMPWYAKLSDAARAAHREASRRLLDLLKQYLVGADREVLLAEARAMGREYCQLGRASGLGLAENVRAFLYFRDFLTESVLQIMEAAGSIQSRSLSELHQLTIQFTNEILIALIEAHQAEGA